MALPIYEESEKASIKISIAMKMIDAASKILDRRLHVCRREALAKAWAVFLQKMGVSIEVPKGFSVEEMEEVAEKLVERAYRLLESYI